MRFLNDKLLDAIDVVTSQNSDAVDLQTSVLADLTATLSANNPANTSFNTGVMDVKTMTCPGITQEQVNTITFPAKASATDGDYIVIPDAAGTDWAIALDTTGGAAQTPTGAAWTAVAAGKKVYVDISADTTAAQVAARVETAFDALTDVGNSFATDDSAADGTMAFTSQIHGPAAVPTPHSYDDGGAGSITAAETNAYAGPADGDYIVFYEPDDTAWAWAVDLQGTQAQTPTGAAWTAVAAGNKVEVDISAVSSAADVAAAVETAIDGLTGFTAVITSDDTAADGTMTLTQIIPGVVSDAVPKDYNDAGAGTITMANTTPGTATDVDVSANSISETAHGYSTGMKVSELTTTGTLPAGLATSTPYYIIVVDDDEYKFASSQANALAGEAVDITDYGTTGAIHTVVVDTDLAGTVKLQKNNEPASETAVWTDLTDAEVVNTTNSQAYSAAGNLNWALRDIGFRELRGVVTNTSGTTTVTLRINAKGG